MANYRRRSSYAMARSRRVMPKTMHLGHVAKAAMIAIAVIGIVMTFFES